MTSKRYIVCVASVLYVFMMINIMFWHGVTKDFFMMDEMARNGSIKINAPLTKNIHYSRHHTEFVEYIASGQLESFDVLTLGDSFSNGKDGGNYQDYLVNQYGLKVINVRFAQAHCLEGLYMLLNSGLIDELKPRVVILECVERYLQNHFGRAEFIPINMPREKVEESAVNASAAKMSTIAKISSGLLAPVIVQWNMNVLYNKLLRLLKPEQLSKTIYVAKLDRKFFTNPGQENDLLYYYEDLHYITDTLDAEMVNQNLNNAARLLKAKGIKLIFFAAPDKYDLYYPYIIDKKGRPENPAFRKMREVSGKEYVFVDAMTPLRDALSRDEQDIYWLNDTHWSHKGIKIFCDELVRYILP